MQQQCDHHYPHHSGASSSTRRWKSWKGSIPLLVVGVALLFLHAVHDSTAAINNSSSALKTSTGSISTITTRSYMTKNDTRIRAYISNGCSGSTVTGIYIREILSAHGFDINNHGTELMQPKKNEKYDQAKKNLQQARNTSAVGVKEPSYEEIIVESLRLSHMEAVERGKILMFKLSTEGNTDQIVSNLQKIGALFAQIDRWNVLDRCICQIRDCFAPHAIGFPVFAENGTETKLCFARRKSKDVHTKAYFYKNKAVMCVQKLERERDGRQKMAADWIRPGKMESYEDLFAYTSTPNEAVFDHSVQAWLSVMSSLLDSVDEKIVRDYLNVTRNTRSAPPSHDDVIYNFNDTVQELQRSALGQYIRF